ncbi:lipopolysaccharide core heptose(II) kinase RfaY [Fusobacterium varium]
MNKEKLGNIFLYYKEEKDRKLYEKIENKEYEIIKIFKNDQRSYVALINIEGANFVYKQPIEKNNRKWQRFLSIFRGSESRREFKNIEKIREVGLNGADPRLAVEKKGGLVVIDSYLIYSYIDGRESSFEDIEMISQELRKIHDLGFLHGDSHLNNFLIKDNKVYLIDTKLEKNKYGNFGKSFEFMYLEESCPEEIDFDKNNIYFKGGRMLRVYLTMLSRIKTKLKNIRRRKK